MAILGFTLPPDSGEKLGLGMQTNKQTKTINKCRKTNKQTKKMAILAITLPPDSGEMLGFGMQTNKYSKTNKNK